MALAAAEATRGKGKPGYVSKVEKKALVAPNVHCCSRVAGRKKPLLYLLHPLL
jgi:hypothetical protein